MSSAPGPIALMFAATVVTANIASVVGCLLMVYHRFCPTPTLGEYVGLLRVVGVVCGIFCAGVLALVYIRVGDDPHSKVFFLGSLPYYLAPSLRGRFRSS